MKPDQTTDTSALRQRAEERLQNGSLSNDAPLSADDMERMLQELKIHQIELEMQNEELSFAHAEKEASRASYADLYDFAPVGYMTLSRAALILEANLFAATLLGVARDVLVRQSLDRFILPDDEDIYRHHLKQLLYTGEPHTCELRLLPTDRAPFWVRMEASVAPNGEGGQPVFHTVISDITESKRLVEELRIKELQLLQQSRQAAAGEMIDNIAHQWRQPLNNLGLTILCIRDDFDAGEMTSEQMKLEAAACMELISFMSQTIEDFRNFTRQDKAKKPFSIRESINRTIALVGASLKDNRITLLVEPGEDAQITGYPNEYTQVLLNLLGNARDVLLGRSVANPQITVKLFCRDSQAVVVVGDNGGGIGSDVIAHVFDPYFTTKEEGEGTGIGLYLSKTIIEGHLGGSLTVANAAGGAEFTIATPL